MTKYTPAYTASAEQKTLVWLDSQPWGGVRYVIRTSPALRKSIVGAINHASKTKLVDFGHPKPLAIGIHDELISLGLPKKPLLAFLAWYCRRDSYLLAVKSGKHRTSIKGQPGDAITRADKVAAREQLVANAKTRTAGKGRAPTIHATDGSRPILSLRTNLA